MYDKLYFSVCSQVLAVQKEEQMLNSSQAKAWSSLLNCVFEWVVSGCGCV